MSPPAAGSPVRLALVGLRALGAAAAFGIPDLLDPVSANPAQMACAALLRLFAVVELMRLIPALAAALLGGPRPLSRDRT